MYGCKEFEEQHFTPDYDGDITPFFLVWRGGGCSFVKKVRNLENIGVALAIIMDNTDENIDQLIMSDDGTGGGIKIPSMIITQKDGQKITKFLASASKSELDSLALMATFKLDKPDNRVEYDMFLSSSNDRALDFIDDFRSTDQKFGENVLFTPHIVTWSCTKCEDEFIE